MARLNLPVDILLWEQMIGEMPLKVITLNLLICVHAYKLGRCDFFCFYAKTFGKVKKVDFSRSKKGCRNIASQNPLIAQKGLTNGHLRYITNNETL